MIINIFNGSFWVFFIKYSIRYLWYQVHCKIWKTMNYSCVSSLKQENFRNYTIFDDLMRSCPNQTQIFIVESLQTKKNISQLLQNSTSLSKLWKVLTAKCIQAFNFSHYIYYFRLSNKYILCVTNVFCFLFHNSCSLL